MAVPLNVMTDAAADIEAHRSYLYRYALLHVTDADRAEEVVQETLLAAIEAQGDMRAGFRSRPG